MTQSNGRIQYRWIVTIYFLSLLLSCYIPQNPLIEYTDGISNILLRIVSVFVPYLITSGLLVVLSNFLKLRYYSVTNRKIAQVGSISCAVIAILSIATVVFLTFARWQGTYLVIGGTIDDDHIFEGIATLVGGYFTGLLILFLGYLRISQPLSTSDSTIS